MFGVIGIDLSEKPLDAFENSVLLSILGEGALAIENRRNALEKEQAALQAQYIFNADELEDRWQIETAVQRLQELLGL